MDFVDYSYFISDVNSLWNLIAVALVAITVIAIMPQINIIVQKRSSVGVSIAFCYFEILYEAFLLINIICFGTGTLSAVFIVPWKKSLPSLIPFISVMFDVFFFQPVLFLCLIFYNKSSDVEEDAKNWREVKKYSVLNILTVLILLILYFSIGVTIGFFSNVMKIYGSVSGIIAAIIQLFEYIPQIVTTYRAKDNGSLSMVMLGIKSPSALIFAFYMWYGLEEDWTTVISVVFEGTAQMTLLLMCIFYKLQKKVEKSPRDLSEVTHIMLQSIVPVE